jgi:hypothetical protein
MLRQVSLLFTLYRLPAASDQLKEMYILLTNVVERRSSMKEEISEKRVLTWDNGGIHNGKYYITIIFFFIHPFHGASHVYIEEVNTILDTLII